MSDIHRKKLRRSCAPSFHQMNVHLSVARLKREITRRTGVFSLIATDHNTTVSPRKFKKELQQVANEGYALDDEEETIGSALCRGSN